MRCWIGNSVGDPKQLGVSMSVIKCKNNRVVEDVHAKCSLVIKIYMFKKKVNHQP